MKKDQIITIIGALIGAFFGCLGWWAAWKLLTSFIGVAAAIVTCLVAAVCAAIGGACVSWESAPNGEVQYTFNGPIARLVRRLVFWWLDCTLKLLGMFKRERQKVELPPVPAEERRNTGGGSEQQTPADETK